MVVAKRPSRGVEGSDGPNGGLLPTVSKKGIKKNHNRTVNEGTGPPRDAMLCPVGLGEDKTGTRREILGGLKRRIGKWMI